MKLLYKSITVFFLGAIIIFQILFLLWQYAHIVLGEWYGTILLFTFGSSLIFVTETYFLIRKKINLLILFIILYTLLYFVFNYWLWDGIARNSGNMIL